MVEEYRGPMKALARALEKDPRYLLDLNRWTFKVDSVTIMVLVTLLLKKGVEAAGGRISRFDNFHLENTPRAWDFAESGGHLKMKGLTRPPCLHINGIIDGWSFEVMVLLSDFSLVKEQLHKFYDITRAPTLAALLPPVFPPPVPEVATASTKAEKKDDGGEVPTKLDQVLDAVLKAQTQEAENSKKAQEQMEAQTQAANESKEALAKLEAQLEAQSLAAKEAQACLKAQLEAQSRIARESQEALKRMEAQLEAQLRATKHAKAAQKRAEAAMAASSSMPQASAASVSASSRVPQQPQVRSNLGPKTPRTLRSILGPATSTATTSTMLRLPPL